MASFMPERTRVSLRIEVGVTSTGQPRYGSVGINHVKNTATADDILAVANAISPCLTSEIVELERVSTDSVEEV